MPKRAPYFHVYIGLMVVFASYAMGATMRVREARFGQKASSRHIATSGLCRVRVFETATGSETAPGGSSVPRTYHSAWETTGFFIGRGKVLIFFERNSARTFNDERPWTVALAARFPGIEQAFPLKIEKYSETNRIALCSFTQPDRIEIPNPLLQGTAQLPSDGEQLRLVGYPGKSGETKREFVPDERLTVRVAAKKVYSAGKFKIEDWSITLDANDWYKTSLGALVLNKQKQVVGILSVHPPGFCGIRDRYIFSLDSVLKNLEAVADPSEIRKSSPPAASEDPPSAR